MILPDKLLLLVSALLLALPATATTAAEPRSGYEYIKQSTRDMQDDDFENPGMLTVEQGRQLFNMTPEGQGKSCAACHGSEAEGLDVTGIARYPVHNGSGIVTLQKQIDSCRENHGDGFPAYRLDIGEITNLHQRIQQCLSLMRAEPFEAGSEEINLMGLYIMSRSNGLKIETPAVRY